jgi:60S ribosome subunit biogenesis protein NIP7
MRAATSVARDDLMSMGTCFGKFTKSHAFRLKVTALPAVAPHAKYKVWVKPNVEMSFLYGNHVSQAGVARMTEGIPQYAGVLVLNMSDVPIGFGRAAQSTERCRGLAPTAIAVLHQADIGEYLREETEVV